MIRRPLPLPGGLDDEPLVPLERARPALEVRGRLLDRRRADPRGGAEERRAELGDELLLGVVGRAEGCEAFAEASLQACLVPRAVGQLV